jgi:hypothetical protein
MRTGNWTDVVFCLQARLVPHVLADAFEGEIPLPPDSLAECGARAAHEERDNTVDSLAADYVQLACLCLDEGGRRAISPRLMETVRFFLFLYVWVIRMTSCFVNSWRGEPLDGRIRT